MNTLAMENTSSRPMFYSNPVLTRLSRVTERVDDGAATYAGIASKTGRGTRLADDYDLRRFYPCAFKA